MSTKANKKKKGSFYRLLAVNYMVFTGIVLCVFIGIYSIYGMLLKRKASVPEIFSFLERAEMTPLENFPELDFQDYLGRGAAVQLVDPEGRILFQSGEDLEDGGYQPEEWDCLSEFMSDTLFLIAEVEDISKGGGYLIIRINYQESGEAAVSGYQILDREGAAVSGTLFPGKKTFSQRELAWLKGTDQQGRKIYSHSYETPESEKYRLVFRFYEPDYGAYQDAYRAWDYIWFLFIPAYLGIAVCCIYFLNRKTKKLLTPFNQAIVSFSQGKPGRLAGYQGPEEFAEIAENFIQMEERLEKSSEERRRLLADISHDLKTPITVISGYAAALRDKMIPLEEEPLYLDAIVKKTERVSQLLAAFHEYSKLDHPGMRAEQRPEDICAVCRGYLAERYQEMELAGFDIEADIPEEPICCPLDQKLFCRALENLLNNSMAYGKTGGTVFVQIRASEDRVFLSVADDGPGVPEEIAPKIFTPFVTGDASRGTGHGSGLGLAIVHQIIALHKGEIRLEIPPSRGYGAEFFISLPRFEEKVDS